MIIIDGGKNMNDNGKKVKKDFMQGVSFSHFLLARHVSRGDKVIDATAGNGKDTVFLAELVGNSGHVFAFDIQDKAIRNTEKLLKKNNLETRVKLIQANHENMLNYIDINEVKGIIFNLGFLPGGDKSIITGSNTTLKALKQGLNILGKGGIIVLVIYTGHPGGEEEKEAVINFCRDLNYREYNVLNYNFINQKKPPAQVIGIKKRIQGD